MSLVGLPGDVLDYDSITLFGHVMDVPGFHGEYSSMSPPSVVLLLHGFTLVSLVFIARRPLQRLLSRPRVWLATTFMMLTAMSLYLWHQLALVAALATLCLLTWSTEYRRLLIWDARPRHGVLPMDAPGWLYVTLVVISGIMIGMGVLVAALAGFSGFPFHSAEMAGLQLNTAVALLVMLLGAAIMRSLTRQPLSS